MNEPNPFAQEEEPGDIASVAYRYFELSSIICNCFGWFFLFHCYLCSAIKRRNIKVDIITKLQR